MTPTGLLRTTNTHTKKKVLKLAGSQASRCRAGVSPYVRRRGDGSLVDDLGRHVLRRAVLAVVLLRRVQLGGVAKVADADLVAGRPGHQDVFRLQGAPWKGKKKQGEALCEGI